DKLCLIARQILPIYLNVRESINEVAKEENFDLILNPSDGTGRSLLLFANEAYEITDKVLIKMGVTP
ncbi:MAG: OmpH family outer membrane protein, partial [Bacteroidota bacterium]